MLHTLARAATMSESSAERLAEVLDGHDNVLVFCHMNPDPDCIASGLAMQLLLRCRFGKSTQICYRGIIGRAQNREMVRLLAPDLKRFRDIDPLSYTAAVLVDAQPEFGFDAGASLEHDLPFVVCIDHHPFAPSTADIPFHDVRPGVGATSTIMTSYLKLFSCEPTRAVATALYYGIKTDTLALTRRTTDFDREAYESLLPLVDHDIVAAIESPPLSPTYFRDLKRAMDRARIQGKLVITDIGRLSYPDMVAEIADFFLKADGVSWSVCMGYYESMMYVSVRTHAEDGDAGQTIRRAVAELGQAGGHNTMAAARITIRENDQAQYTALEKTVRERLIVGLEVKNAPVRPLAE